MNAKSRLELLAERKAEAEQKAAAAKPLIETERALRACANEGLAFEMQPWRTESREDSVEWAERMDWKAYAKKWIKSRVAPALRLLAKLMEEHSWAYDDLAAGVDDDGLEQRRECKQWMREAVRPLVCVKAKASVVTGVGRDVGDMLSGDHGCWQFYHEFFGELAKGIAQAVDPGKQRAKITGDGALRREPEIEDVPEETPPPSLGAGGTSITCRGTTYSFTGVVQRQVMEFLFNEWKRHGMRDGVGTVIEDHLHVELGRENRAQKTRLAKVFRSRADVREILVKVAPATWALFLTGDPPKESGW